jgi:hypothetical protein
MKWTIFCSSLVSLALLLLPQQGQALSFTVDAPTVNVSGTFSINLNVVDAIDLTSWQFDLAYNPAILQANLVTEGPFLSSFGTTLFTPGFIDNTTGLISGVANAFVDISPLPNGSGVLATVQFTELGSGVSPLEVSNVFLNLADSASGFIVTNSEVTLVSSVSEPSALLLLSLGLGIFLLALRQPMFGKRGG